MNVRSPTLFQAKSEESPYALNKITEELVSSKEGRKSYFDFLRHHESIDPIKKLYGLEMDAEIDSKEVSAHAKRLYRHIHPDKVKGEDNITELFRLVRSAEEACRDVKNDFIEFNHPSGLVSCLISLLNRNKWCQVKTFLMKELHSSNESLKVLAAVVFFRLGDFSTAIECIPSQLVKTKAFLEECEKQLALDLPVEERVVALTQLLDGFGKLPEIYAGEKLPHWPSEGLFNRIIPHRLLVLLKDCFRMQNNEIMVERYLREAIRRCPNGLQMSDDFYMEKQGLIEELRILLKHNYHYEEIVMTSFLKAETSRLTVSALNKVFSDLQATTLPDENKTEISKLVSLSKKNIGNLRGLVDLIEKLVEKSTKVSSVASYISYMSSGISQQFTNYTGYSKQTQDVLKSFLDPLKGWLAYYQNNNIELAAHYFLKCQDYSSLGCMYVALGRYAQALDLWSKHPSMHTHRYIFILMNYCDQSCVSEDVKHEVECLGSVDQFQLNALKAFHK